MLGIEFSYLIVFFGVRERKMQTFIQFALILAHRSPSLANRKGARAVPTLSEGPFLSMAMRTVSHNSRCVNNVL